MPPKKNPIQAMRENLAELRAQGASIEEQRAELERWKPVLARVRQQEMAEQGPMTGGERAANAFRTAYQGATFNLGDEFVGGLRGLPRAIAQGSMDPIREEIANEREGISRFREENPKMAFGLELAGGAATGIGAARSALAGGKVLQGVGRVAATGAGGGAIAGFGAGDGMGDRAMRAGLGAAGGAVLGAVMPVVARGVPNMVAGGQQLTDEMMEQGVRRAFVPTAAATGAANSAVTGASAPDGPSLGQMARQWGNFRNRGRTTPVAPRGFSQGGGASEPALRATGRAFGGEEGIQAARQRVTELEAAGMGDEMLAMNAGGFQTASAVRAAANLPNSTGAQTVNDRLARQGGRIGEQVPDDLALATGFTDQIDDPVAQRTRYKYPEENLDDMQRSLRQKVDAGYEAFRALPEVPLDPSDEAQRMFIERYVQPVIENRRLSGQLSNASALSGDVVDAAFKDLQLDLQSARRALQNGNGGTVEVIRPLEAMKARVLEAISQTDPNYAQLGRTYAMDDEVGKVVQEAFASGQQIRTPGAAIVARRGTAANPSADRALRAGNVSQMQQNAGQRSSNADLEEFAKFADVARAAIGTSEARDTFIQMHGKDAYDRLLARLLPKIKAAAQNAVARGNTTTARQLLETLAMGDDAALDLFGSMALSSPQQAVTRGLLKRAITPLEQRIRRGVGDVAGETADLLTTRGATRTKSLFDVLDELGQRDARDRAVGLGATTALSGRPQRQR